MKKKLVFISHITEEKAIAVALKALIENTFQGLMTVFVSSDPSSNPVGCRWLDGITAALKECAVEIILLSPESIKRPWINFEAGCGWIQDIPVIPLCHSGLEPGKLPAPMSNLMGALASDEEKLKLIFPVIATAFGSALPPIDFTGFVATVKEFEQNTKKMRELNALSPLAATDGLSQHEFSTLVGVAEELDGPGDDVSVTRARGRGEELGLTKIAVSLAIIKLERMGFIETGTGHDYNGDEYQALRVTPEGWAWLESNKDRLTMTKNKPRSRSSKVEAEEASDGDIPF